MVSMAKDIPPAEETENLRNRINKYFDLEAQKLLADVSASATLTTHSTTQGNAGEEAFRSFLRRHLPTRYGVGTGHVVSFWENSAQADIVVYDHLDCFTIPITETSSLVSVQGVQMARYGGFQAPYPRMYGSRHLSASDLGHRCG